MKTYLLPLCAALFLLPAIASAAPAQTNDEGASVKTDAKSSVREIIFDQEDNVDGEVLKPGGVNVGGQVAKAHANMIGIRGEFIPQLIALSNDI